MPPTCQTCQRDDLNAINSQLVQGLSLRNIAERSGIPTTSLFRHKEQCIPQLLETKANEIRAGLLKDIDEVRQEIAETKADFPDNPTVRVALIGKRLDAIDKEARLTGAFTKDGENAQTVADLAQKVVDSLVASGWPEAEARAFAAGDYDAGTDAVN